MRLAADTGALLSLACSRHSRMVFDEHTFLITDSVLQELESFAHYNDFLGMKAKELSKRKFRVKKPRTRIALGLALAETEVFMLAKEEKLLALTDDVHAARVAYERLRLRTRLSFYLLFLLYKKGRIKKEDLTIDLQSILRYRNWLGGALWEYVLHLMEQLE